MPKPHIIVSENPLKEGQDYTSLCQKPITKAYFVRTEGDIRLLKDWINALLGTCRACCDRMEKLCDEADEPYEVHVYFAVDGQLASLYQKTDVPEIQREA